ncbi:MAG: hypothetical protein B9S33_00745 [Pedosphaera sp. Tous-C6FEB]|nr:MAG: hypothetical protein B9S33_00745 [Pedosphaera sp. Tous-C6FEB]
MNTRTAVTLGLVLLTHTFANGADLLTNGSFESGATGWTLAGGAPRYQQVGTAYAGTNALRVFNRANFTNAPQQDVTVALAAVPNGGTWTTRFAVQVAAPTTVRAWLRVVVDNAGVIATNRLLLAERVVRATNQWERITGTQTFGWTGAVSNALFYVECGMKQEPTGKAYPDAIFDDFAIRLDADGDGLWDQEEVPVLQGGLGTSPSLADTDGDALPDGWEFYSGTNPLVADATADPDGDGFTNWQEFRTATSATNALSFPGQPTHASLTTNATAVLKYLAKLPYAASNRFIPGQHLTDTAKEWTNHVVRLQQVTGRWPGLVSFTAESSVTNTPVQTAGIIPYAFETWTNGGLVLIKWAPWNPWSGKFGAASVPTLIDIPELLNPAPALTTNQVARSNYLAWRQSIGDDLTTLRDAGMPVLWRPFAEMNGTWFWWGNLPRDHYHALWRDLHGYFTQTRGLTNLLWVFEPDQTVHLVGGSTSSGTPIDYYYPGDDVVDVVGHNFYDDDWALPYRSDEIWSRSGKIFAVPQAGPSHQKRDGSFDNLTYLNGITNTIARCAFIAVWNNIAAGTNLQLIAIADNLNASNLLAHPLAITRDEVNWQAELPVVAPPPPPALPTAELLANGGFESALTGWVNYGPLATVRTVVTPGRTGGGALSVSNRTGATNGLAQNVLAGLLANGSGQRYVTRAWLKSDLPTSVRVRLLLTDAAGAKSRFLLAERQLREMQTNQWSFIEGLQTVTWTSAPTNALLYFETGQLVENVFPTYLLDDVSLQPDTDGDRLANAEELVLGTNPLLADTDGDGIPDGWETRHGFNPLSAADASWDRDGDGFTNAQEYWAATDPTLRASFPGKASTTNATDAARQILLRLAVAPSQPTNRCFSGQTLTGGNVGVPTEYTNFFLNLAQQTGHTPAVMQLTYEVPPTNLQATVMNPFAISHWQAGGLVLVHYAPPNPVSNGHPGDTTNVVNLTTLFTPGTATHTNWMRSLDRCADGLQQLRDAGVVVMFTILHENNGSWLWWHKRPRADYVALYRGVHDYFTRVRGLNNLLWIFHPSEATHDLLPMDYYYPGDEVVDLIGPSVYSTTFQFPFSMDELFRAYPKAFGLTEASAAVASTNAWDLTILTTNLATTLPRAAYFCAWSSFKVGAGPLVRYSLVDHTNVTTLLNAPHIANRAAVDWPTYLPMNLSLRRQGNVLTVDWAGGALDYSTNLVHWTAVTNAAQSWQPAPDNGVNVFRVRRER